MCRSDSRAGVRRALESVVIVAMITILGGSGGCFASHQDDDKRVTVVVDNLTSAPDPLVVAPVALRLTRYRITVDGDGARRFEELVVLALPAGDLDAWALGVADVNRDVLGLGPGDLEIVERWRETEAAVIVLEEDPVVPPATRVTMRFGDDRRLQEIVVVSP